MIMSGRASYRGESMKYEENPSAWWYVVPGVALGAGIYWYLRSGKAVAAADAAVAIEEEDEAIAAAEDKEDRRTRRQECRARGSTYKWNLTTKQCEYLYRVTHMKQINLKAFWAGHAKTDCSSADIPMGLRWRCRMDKAMAIKRLESMGLRVK